MCYARHPYRWPTIGLTPEHIEKATLEDVKRFYDKWYQPSNAILAISGKYMMISKCIIENISQIYHLHLLMNAIIHLNHLSNIK